MVGLKDKLKKYNEEHRDDGFHPLELNEANLQASFNRRLKSAETTEIEYTTLFKRDLGSENRNPCPF